MILKYPNNQSQAPRARFRFWLRYMQFPATFIAQKRGSEA